MKKINNKCYDRKLNPRRTMHASTHRVCVVLGFIAEVHSGPTFRTSSSSLTFAHSIHSISIRLLHSSSDSVARVSSYFVLSLTSRLNLMTSEASLPAGIEHKDSTVFTCAYCEKDVPKGSVKSHVKGRRHKKKKEAYEEKARDIIDVDDDDGDTMDVEVDKDAFLKSILGGSDEGDAEAEAGDADVEMSLDESAARINQSFAPLEFKPADGVDNFFDSMPEEAERTEVSKDIRSILEATPKKKKIQPADNTTPSKMSLAVNVEQGKDTATNSGPAEDDPNAMPPWIIGADSANAIRYSNHRTTALHYEILEFGRFLAPTDEERAIREKLATTVQNIVKALWPACRIETFGSYATGLYLPSSDIDVCVMESPRDGSEEEMEELATAIRSVNGFARKVHVIRARVGLVKIVSRYGNVQCDISFGRSNGPKNVPIILKYIKDYPALRPLLLVVKYFLQQRSLNEVYTGGLGSYAVLLLVVSHLQTLQQNFPGIDANLGDLLTHFFFLYGRMFNFCVAGIQVGKGKYYNKVQRYDTKPGETMRFSIEDPNEIENEIGNNSFAASRVRKAFGNAYILLNQWSRENRMHPMTPLSRIIAPDKSFKARRERVLGYLQRDGTTELSKYIQKNRIRPPPQGRIQSRIVNPNAHRGNGNGHAYDGNNHNNNSNNSSRNHYDGQKRRRTNNNNHNSNNNSRNYQNNNNRNRNSNEVFVARYNGPRASQNNYGHTGNALVYHDDGGRDMSSSMAARLGPRNRNNNHRDRRRGGGGGGRRN